MTEDDRRKQKGSEGRLSLHPLPIEEALRGAMATGKPPEMPKRERPAAKQRLKDAKGAKKECSDE